MAGDQIVEVVLDEISQGRYRNPLELYAHIRSKVADTYLRYFQEAFTIEKADRFDVKGGGNFGTPSKYCFTDVGLRYVRLNFRRADENHLLENVGMRPGLPEAAGEIPYMSNLIAVG